MSLFSELKRRNVFRVVAAYIIVAWLVMQVGETMAPALHLPSWVPSALAFFLILGFPVAIVLSWAFEITPQGIKLETSVDPDGPPRKLSGRKLDFAIIALLVVVILFLAFDKFVLGTAQEAGSDAVSEDVQYPAEVDMPAADAVPSIAVLAFEDMSPQKDQAYLSDGVAEEVLNALAQISDLRVISRSSAFAYKDKEINLPTVARDLSVEYILEGSVRKDGNRVRITAQLIDAVADTHVWSETYDRTLDDIFAVQEDVAHGVVASLRATLSPRLVERMSARTTDNLAAYELYLQAREAFNRRDAVSNQDAVRLFTAATELDPNYALAWAGLADGYVQRDGRFGYARGATVEIAIEHARRALAIDPDLAEGHNALGGALTAKGDQEDALRTYLAAIELNPNYYEAWIGVSRVHMLMGDYDESLWAAQQAERMAPNEIRPHYMKAHNYKFLSLDARALESANQAILADPRHVGGLLLPPQLAIYQGDPERSLRLVEQLLERVPRDLFAHVGAAGMAYMARDYDRAIEWAGEAQRREPGNIVGYWHRSETLLGLSMLLSGDRAAADEILDAVIERNTERTAAGGRDWDLQWDVAAIYAARGENELAMDWLQRAYDAGFHFVRWPPVDPAFDGLRDHPVYRDVMENMQVKTDAMRQRVIDADPLQRGR